MSKSNDLTAVDLQLSPRSSSPDLYSPHIETINLPNTIVHSTASAITLLHTTTTQTFTLTKTPTPSLGPRFIIGCYRFVGKYMCVGCCITYMTWLLTVPREIHPNCLQGHKARAILSKDLLNSVGMATVRLHVSGRACMQASCSDEAV